MELFSSFKNKKSAAFWYNSGNALIRSRDINGAIDCYDKAIEIDPWFYRAWINRGMH